MKPVPGLFPWLLVSASLFAAPLWAADQVSNQDINSLAKAGLSSAVMLEKVRSSPCGFDTSTEGLIELKQAGVPDEVIEAIVASKCVQTQQPIAAPKEEQLPAAQPRADSGDKRDSAASQQVASGSGIQILSTGIEPRYLLKLDLPDRHTEKLHMRGGFWGGDGACPPPETFRKQQVLAMDFDGKARAERNGGAFLARTNGEFSLGGVDSAGFHRFGPIGQFSFSYEVSPYGEMRELEAELVMEGEKIKAPENSMSSNEWLLVTPEVPVGVGARWRRPMSSFSAQEFLRDAAKDMSAEDLRKLADAEVTGGAFEVVEIKEASNGRAKVDITYEINFAASYPDEGGFRMRGAGHKSLEWRKDRLVSKGMSSSMWLEMAFSEPGQADPPKPTHCAIIFGSTL